MKRSACVFFIFAQFLMAWNLAWATGPKEWTVLVFLNGHNSLDSFGQQNVNAMSTVGSTDQMDVVVQWASEANGNTRRIHVTKGSFDLVQDMAPVDMGDFNSLVQFVEWGMKNYPAKKYLVDVWDHGNGWHLVRPLFHGVHPQDLSFDDKSGHVITTEQLGQALRQVVSDTGNKVELYGSDACMMAMVEVAAEVSDSVKFFAGSEETEPDDGWPYAAFLADLAQNPTWDGGAAAKDLSAQYKAAYSGGVYGTNDVTFSAWDLSQLPSLYEPLQNLAKTLSQMDTADLTSTSSAVNGAQSYASQDYHDLGDFMVQMNQAPLRLPLTMVSDVQSAIRKVLLENDVTGAYTKSVGISIWLPTSSSDWTPYKDRYQNLRFNKATGWYDFLAKLQTVSNTPNSNTP